MDVSNFTDKSKEAITLASNVTTRNRNAVIADIHMVFAFLEKRDGLVCALFEKMEVDVDSLKNAVQNEIDELPKVSGPVALRFSPEVERALDDAGKAAKSLKDDLISVEHLMIGVLERATVNLKQILKVHKIDKASFVKALRELRGNPEIIEEPEEASSVLAQFGRDLTQAARDNKLDPVIGRDDEIRNVIRILTRKTKNNPVLIGLPGVGKTAIAEGLSLRIVRGDVPTSLKDKMVFSLDLGSLIAGAKFRGEFEERLKTILEEIDKSNGKILLFIDEIHNIVGAGGGGEGAMDASNLLKPMLARGELHCIGATTLDEYREYIEKDPALARRFQQVLVEEPTVEDAITILRGIQEKFEIFHGVKIQDEALIAAATLSNRYITDRHLPDKAIDLIDEACALIRSEVESMPIELDQKARRIMALEIEEASLSRSDDLANEKKLVKVRNELAKLRDELQEMKVKWEAEKKNISRIQKLKEKIDEVNKEIEKAERVYDLNKAADLKYTTLPNLKLVLQQEEREIEKQGGSKFLRNKVTAEEIENVVSRWTGIPVNKLAEGEREKLLNLENILHERVVGQEEAVTKVSEAILRARAGIANPNRPIVSFLFLGPTGVGKTELGKTLAATLFDDEKNMIRFDMSEYMEKFSVTRLIGAPPGYVGYEEGGQLTEAVIRRPYSVLLFDEVEKAHPDVFNIFLQILDDGRVTDSQGRTVDFKNTIIILTSNLGSKFILESIQKHGTITDAARDEISNVLKDYFRPEFLNRLDETICFRALDKSVVNGIVDNLLKGLFKRVKGQGVEMTVSDEAKTFLIEEGYDINFGARPLKRIIQSEIETLMARKLIAKEIVAGDIVEIVYDKEEEDLNVVVTGKQKTEDEVVGDLLEETETANEEENKNSEE